MTSFTLIEVQLAMALGLFLFGAISLSIGMFVLLVRSAGREVRSLANQTAQLARKGMAEEVAGLVGNASALLGATNDLVRTAAGIGVFLSALGLILMLAACWLVIRIS
ncbi:MAG TPA: hypothetical protein VI776_03895 [Anaerolineales bacterium]|jgi:hypothetical protein|nr:hypothetical protein [Anaerolineales bacterium]